MMVQKIALFDMDGVLVDYVKKLKRDLNKLKSPSDDFVDNVHDRDLPKYILNRIELIKRSEYWWSELPRLKLGWDIIGVVKEIGFDIAILSKGPSDSVRGYSGKKIWVHNNLGDKIPLILTGNKGMVYGRVLVDDYPVFIEEWLKYRPRGFVVMPANKFNSSFKHPRVIRYTGRNLKQVKLFLKKAYQIPFIEI